MPYSIAHGGGFCNGQGYVACFGHTGIYYGVMIWLRRAVAVPVVVLLLPVLLFLLLFQAVHSTLLSPGFHASGLRKADVYEFALGDLLTVALEEAREIETGPVTVSIDGEDRVLLRENPLVASGLSSEDVAASLRRVAPPEWVQGVVEQWLDQAGGYLTGERDDFVLEIGLREQALILVEEVKLLQRKAGAGDLLFEALVEPEMERAAVADVPFGLDVSAERLTESARRVAGPDWIQGSRSMRCSTRLRPTWSATGTRSRFTSISRGGPRSPLKRSRRSSERPARTRCCTRTWSSRGWKRPWAAPSHWVSVSRSPTARSPLRCAEWPLPSGSNSRPRGSWTRPLSTWRAEKRASR